MAWKVKIIPKESRTEDKDRIVSDLFSKKPEEDARFLGTGIMDSSELPCGSSEPNMSPLQE